MRRKAGSTGHFVHNRAMQVHERFEHLYRDLKRLARGRLAHAQNVTLMDPTSLVHDAFVRVCRHAEVPLEFGTEAQFFAYMSRTMRSIVIDAIRARQADRRGAGLEKLSLDATGLPEVFFEDTRRSEELHEALQALEQVDERLSTVVGLKYFGGLTDAELAACLQLSERTIQRELSKAHRMLAAMMQHGLD